MKENSDNVYKIKQTISDNKTLIKYREYLNEEQLKIVTSDLCPTIVIAGAGSGKTRVITYRVAYLLDRFRLRDIILLTFTNKAAKEMLSRVGQIFPQYFKTIKGGTFHHIAVGYLRRYADILKFKSNFTILDNEDAKELMELSIDELSLKRDSFVQASVLLDIYGLMINTLKSAEDVIYEKKPYLIKYTEEISRVLIRYNQKKESSSLMDFDDILKFFYVLLTQEKEARRAIVEEISAVLVDEFQDTTPIQAEIAYALSSENNNIMVVGDDAQSIYSFRGASVDNMLNFPQRFPDCKIYNLKTNYRSTQNILEIAQRIISNNSQQFPKELIPIRGKGERPWLVIASDPQEEARFVASRISELINDGHKASEIAVLYRAHHHSMDLQMELMRANIPFVVRSGLRFFEQAHLKDAISLLRVIYNPEDEISFRRLIKLFSGIGNVTANSLREDLIKSRASVFDWVKECRANLRGGAKAGFEQFKSIILAAEPLKDSRPSELMSLFMKEFYSDYLKRHYTDAIEREADLNYFIDFISRFEDLHQLFAELALISNLEVDRSHSQDRDLEDFVVLSSVHQAKGLEFKSLFVIGLAEGMFPSQFSTSRLRDLEEERRLFYVAVTRAKDNLYLSYPNSVRRQDSNLVIKKRSRFLDEIEDIERLCRIMTIEYE